MSSYAATERASPQQGPADGGAAEHRTGSSDHAPAGDALGAALNESPRSQSLMQLRAVLDGSPRVQAQLALQRALNDTAPVAKKTNATGLPDRLKAGVEQLSGLALDDVRVHYNSPNPTALQALAYAQSSDIHLGPGQEKHLPHEAWHVVQQKQGRVQPMLQMKGVAINDDAALEREADAMGAKAAAGAPALSEAPSAVPVQSRAGGAVHQLVKASQLFELGEKWHRFAWIKGDYSKNQEIIAKLEEDTGFKSGTVFQKYDLYIRGSGPSKYVDIVKGLDENHAATFLSFLDDETDFEDLPDELQKLAVIVCVSETGRGYGTGSLRIWLNDIVSGESDWSQVKTGYAPSLTYKEDAGEIGEYIPSEQESDEDDDVDESISDTELEDLQTDALTKKVLAGRQKKTGNTSLLSSNPTAQKGRAALGGGAAALGAYALGGLALGPALGVGAAAGLAIWGASKFFDL
jgi:hypothetical protein